MEKWYTECGSKHPIQNGPWCDVEAPMYSAFNAIKVRSISPISVLGIAAARVRAKTRPPPPPRLKCIAPLDCR